MNIYAVRAIYYYEMARTGRTLMQSILSPVISTSLYFIVFGSAIGSRMAEVEGIPYAAFIIPGLTMLSLLTEARIYRPQLVARFVLNRCATRTVIARETAETLADHDPPVLAATIDQRIVFADAAQSGRLASEIDSRSPAAREIAALASEIGQLDIGRDGS